MTSSTLKVQRHNETLGMCVDRHVHPQTHKDVKWAHKYTIKIAQLRLYCRQKWCLKQMDVSLFLTAITGRLHVAPSSHSDRNTLVQHMHTQHTHILIITNRHYAHTTTHAHPHYHPSDTCTHSNTHTSSSSPIDMHIQQHTHILINTHRHMHTQHTHILINTHRHMHT